MNLRSDTNDQYIIENQACSNGSVSAMNSMDERSENNVQVSVYIVRLYSYWKAATGGIISALHL